MSLVDPNDTVLTLADGTVVKASGDTVRKDKPKLVEVPTHREAQRIVVATRKRLDDLPMPPKQMNAVGVVLMYMLFGLHDDDIAIATGMTVQQIGTIKLLEAFTEMHDAVVRSFVENEASDVRNIFASHAREAAMGVVTISRGNDALAFAAQRDVLDRAGHRPVDVIDHRHTLDGGLTINIVKKADPKSVPTIDLGE